MEKGHNDSVSFMIKKIKKEKEKGNRGVDIGCGNGWAVRKMKKELEYKSLSKVALSPNCKYIFVKKPMRITIWQSNTGKFKSRKK